MILEIHRALLIGAIAAIPIGPVFVMVVQRTLCHNRRAGLMVGLGAAAGDTVYAAVSLLTLELIKNFVLAHQGAFMMAGGVILAVIGVRMFFREISLSLPAEQREVSGWTCALEAFTSTLSNPAALATMLALMTAFRLDSSSARTPIVLLAPLVGLGELGYWTVVTGLLKRYLRVEEKTLRFGSRLAGVLICVFATVLEVRGAMMIIGN